jgi:hypothetical protein
MQLKPRLLLMTTAVVFFSSVTSFAFSQVLVDNFNRSNSTTVGNGWNESETSTSGAQIKSNQLVLGSTTSGRDYIYRDISTNYDPILTNNNCQMIWQFNMRQPQSNPSGFGSSDYGVAFVLGATNSNLTLGDGYAVVLGETGGTDQLRLVRFSNGLDLNSNLTNIIGGGSFGNQYFAIKVIYDPITDEWQLFQANSSVSFPDPSTATYVQVGSTVSNTFFTSSSLKYLSCFWNHATQSIETLFDNIYLPSLAPLTSSISAQTNVDCFGNNTGSVTVAGAGGTSPYSYSKDGLDFTNTTGVFGSLVAGSYTITVKDANGCTVSNNIEISEPPVLAATVTSSDATCFSSSSGSIAITGATGGSGQYQYSINGTDWFNTGSFTSLPAGTYQVSIRDKSATGCVIDLDGTTGTQVGQLGQLDATVEITPTANSCNGSGDGAILVTVTSPSGGSGTYNYGYKYDRVSPTAFSSGFTNLNNITSFLPGTYTVTVRVMDAADMSCYRDLLFEDVIVPDAPIIHATFTATTTPVLCPNTATGTIDVEVTSTTGGSGTYQYGWTWTRADGGIGNYFTATGDIPTAEAGIYSVTLRVSDLNNLSCYQEFTMGNIVVGNAEDKESPVLTEEADQNVNLGAECKIIVPNVVDGSSATDNCGATITQLPLAGTEVSVAHNGTVNVTVTATDAAGNTDIETVVLTAKDVTAPVLTEEADQNVNLGAECKIIVPNVVDGSSATDNCGATITQLPLAGTEVSVAHNGTVNVTVTATDAAGNTDIETVVLTAKDVTAPQTPAVSVNSSSLWPPNHKMRDVKVTMSAQDNCSATCRVISITSNEPINNDGSGDGNTEVDWEIPTNPEGAEAWIKLRAERSGNGDGRVYTILVECTDAAGNKSQSSTTVTVAHNISAPVAGSSVKIGTTINMAGTFWDVAGNKHTAKWLVDGASVNGTVVSEPVGTKNGTVKGSYKLATAGVYKLQMNITDQKGITSYATTSGYDEAIVVAYDPNGGYTYGGKKFKSPKGALPSQPNVAGEMTYGFQTNYYKGATNPKGETWFILNNGEFEFNALNFEYLVVNGAKAQFKGLGKMVRNGVEQSGIAFILTVIDGQLTGGGGTDKIRMKIYNKNTGEIYYDSQPGASDADNPTTVVENNAAGDGVVVVNTNMTTTAARVNTNVAEELEITPATTYFDLKAYPNPTTSQFNVKLESPDSKTAMMVRVIDLSGKVIEVKRGLMAGQTFQLGANYRPGMYFIELTQGDKRRIVKVVKQPE